FDLRSSVPNEPFTAELAVTFTYKENDWHDGDPLSNYILRFEAIYKENLNKTVVADDLDTTEELNRVLASRFALAEYLEAAGVDFAWEGLITLTLPSVEYEGKVVCNIQDVDNEFIGVELRGSPNLSVPKPIMHALEDRGGLWSVTDICFENKDVTQTYGGNEFTCGVLVNCSGQTYGSSIGAIWECSFSGFDYAIRGTATGYPGNIRNCSFNGCDYGLYIDCPGLNAMINTDVTGNTFRNCEDAICIPKLPYSITSYIYRIHDNSFLGSQENDINITQEGTFFCYGNFFGVDNSNRRSAILHEGPNTRIIVNPCRERIDSHAYWIDPAHSTEILNTDAGSMAIDAAVFTGDGTITISVVDAGEAGLDTIGTWIFGGAGA
ncbi:MAG: hypothetical protein IIY28_00245, partial [Lachnospiraceae bacterium]|nr:hypothetical protein [Lachnospiraceae bacterium]